MTYAGREGRGGGGGAPDLRAVFAALSHPGTRRVFAQIVLGGPDPVESASPRGRKALSALLAAGIVEQRDDGWFVTDAFSVLLAAAGRTPRREGVARFLASDGRIDQYPSGLADRRALLAHVASQTLRTPDEDIDEVQLNERLLTFTDDVAALRRHLVDEGFVMRTRDGSSYRSSGAA
ncbi:MULTISPECIES: DUF2087 domain-containing protein [unclassified Microbacterium]|uniref:DUF2087 domain-containing protein n=1 Tax=unclassified Microbacterium TaxID=2609290 RepID=UPI00386968AF